jgi:iron(II)-dependent oxidoreductase
LQGGDCTQYPWGDLFNPSHANLWTAGLGKTAPIDSFPGGDTPSGIRQLCGNVWEWVEDALDSIPCDQDELFHVWKPMRRILGGAFDTYFPAEAASSFMTGHGELGRRHNIGFRCVVSHEDLVTEDFLNTTGEAP